MAYVFVNAKIQTYSSVSKGDRGYIFFIDPDSIFEKELMFDSIRKKVIDIDTLYEYQYIIRDKHNRILNIKNNKIPLGIPCVVQMSPIELDYKEESALKNNFIKNYQNGKDNKNKKDRVLKLVSKN